MAPRCDDPTLTTVRGMRLAERMSKDMNFPSSVVSLSRSPLSVTPPSGRPAEMSLCYRTSWASG